MTADATVLNEGHGPIVCERDFALSDAAEAILSPRIDAMIVCRMTARVVFVYTTNDGRRGCTCGGKTCAHVRAAADLWVMTTVRRAQLATCNRRGLQWHPIELFAYMPHQITGRIWFETITKDARGTGNLLRRKGSSNVGAPWYTPQTYHTEVAATREVAKAAACSMRELLALGGTLLNAPAVAGTTHARAIRLRASMTEVPT